MLWVKAQVCVILPEMIKPKFLCNQSALFILMLSLTHLLNAQPDQTLKYDKNYFRNPLNIPISLSANFGELRSDHWHMGLDIRTNRKQNYPVYAAAAGYISRIGVKSFGFGRVIYITHPNGLTTVYGHLNDFFPELETYLKEQQYKSESWEVDLELKPDQFPVSKGSFIAYSGNTGGSQGPHLHFEIRDSKNGKCINPLLFNLPVTDKMPPTLSKLAMYDRTISTYEQSPQLFMLKAAKAGEYTLAAKKIITGNKKVSFALAATDRSNSSSSPNGIYSAKICIDDKPLTEFVLDEIGYDETLYLNAQIDYRYKYKGGGYLQHISKLPGNNGPVYHNITNDGVIEFADTLEHRVTVDVYDVAGNLSTLDFNIVYYDSLTKQNAVNAETTFAPGQVSDFKKENFEARVLAGTLYDTVHTYFNVQNKQEAGSVSQLFQLNEPYIPVQEKFVVRIKPSLPIPENAKNKVFIKNTYGKSNSWRKATWEGDWLKASAGNFGYYQAFIDTEAPVVNDIGKGDTIDLSRASRIVFTPKDNVDIAGFRATLDGRWLRFTNDKGRNYIYTFDEKCPDGVHELKVIVKDIAGNATEKSWWFKKLPYIPPVKKAPAKKQSTKKTVVKKKG